MTVGISSPTMSGCFARFGQLLAKPKFGTFCKAPLEGKMSFNSADGEILWNKMGKTSTSYQKFTIQKFKFGIKLPSN
jgi:hypothetical protein